MALLTDAARTYENEGYNSLPVAATTKIYGGAAVGDSSGNARGLVAGDKFHGFAEEQADNSAGGAGDIKVRVRTSGRIVLPVTGVSGVGDIGKTVYASDDGTFTLTKSTNSPIGRIVRHESSTRVVVEFGAKMLTTIPDPTDTPASADALRDDLVANVLPAIRSALDNIVNSKA